MQARHPPVGPSPFRVPWLARPQMLMLLGPAAAALLLLATLALPFRSRGGRCRGGAAALPAFSANGGGGGAAIDFGHPLFSQVKKDLGSFSLSGIGQRHVEQAYCQGSRGSMRVQVGPRRGTLH